MKKFILSGIALGVLLGSSAMAEDFIGSIKLGDSNSISTGMSKVTVSMQQAIKAAQKSVSGKVTKVELENEDDYLIYEVGMTNAKGQKIKVDVDPVSAKVLEVEKDNDKKMKGHHGHHVHQIKIVNTIYLDGAPIKEKCSKKKATIKCGVCKCAAAKYDPAKFKKKATMKCGAGKCGVGKCGAGKCAAAKYDPAKFKKKVIKKCGAGKCGAGKCGSK